MYPSEGGTRRCRQRSGIHDVTAYGRFLDGRALRATDPRWVNDYQLMRRLVVGGAADVFYAETASGEPAVIKLFRGRERSTDVCRREFRLLYAAGGRCTPATLGYGVSVAGAYLVTTYLPGYECAANLVLPTTSGVAPPSFRLTRQRSPC